MDNSQKIRELREVLQSGVTSASVDGTSTTVDLNEIRRQLAELERTDDTALAEGRVRPKLAAYRFS